MEIKEILNIEVSSETLADLLGIKNRNYISELVNKHNFPRSGFNQYPLIPFMQRWNIYQKKKFIRKMNQIRAEKPQDDLARKSAKLKEIQIQEKIKTLINAKDVYNAWMNEISIISSLLDGVEIKASSLLINVPDQLEAKKILGKILNEVRIKIAKLKLDT